MVGSRRRTAHSHRAWLVALFVALAMILGGGGTPSPGTEIVLQLAFAAFVLAWIWLDRGAADHSAADRLVFPLVAVVLIVPAVQLVPLPPSVWQALPGRADQLAALELVGAADTWRPIALSPSRTLASLLAMVPAALCIYAVATLTLGERRLVLLTIVVIAVASGLLGMVQLLAGGEGANFYRVFSRGWVTGFQANRNSQADVLLIALLALAALVASRSAAASGQDLKGKSSIMLAATVGVFFLAALLLTGSRAGIALAVPALAIAGLMLVPSLDNEKSGRLASLATVAVLPLIVALMVGASALFGSVPVGRALSRFSDLEGQRLDVWQDTMFAIAQYWPVGVGMGGFPPTILAAERLEAVDNTFPNRAHNEYLEIALESGVIGYLAVAVAAALIVAMAMRSWRRVPPMRRQILFGLGALMVIGLHSVVDYPLRSMALAVLAGVAAGMIARPGRRASETRTVEGQPEMSKGFL